MTPREREFVDVLRRLTVDEVVPTYDELAVAMGLSSKSGVARMVDQMVNKGIIRRGVGKRSLQIVADTADPYCLAAINNLPDRVLTNVGIWATQERARRLSARRAA